MEVKAQNIIKEIKRIKEKNKITYIDIMEQMEEINPSSVVSLSTLRRICSDGAEMKASSFNYEQILLPVYNAILTLSKEPKSESEHDKELNGYKAVIRVQNEELDRLLELREHLEERVDFLVDRINFLTDQVKQKDEIIKRLMEKCL